VLTVLTIKLWVGGLV